MEKLKPRYLTNDEIKNIVSKIPLINSSQKLSGITARDSLIRKETFRLRCIKLIPTAIDEFTNRYINKHFYAKIDWGTDVGAIASESISQQVSQQAMDSFKVEAARNVSGNIASYEEVLEVRNRKQYGMFVFYKDNPTIIDILNHKRVNLETITIYYLTSDIQVERFDTFYPQGPPYWYSMYKSSVLLGNLKYRLPSVKIEETGNYTWIMQLRLNLSKMYRNKILPTDIVNVLTQESILNCVYSPLFKDEDGPYMLMDIYVEKYKDIIDKKGTIIPIDEIIFMYIYNTLTPSLDRFIIKGCQNIMDVHINVTPINFSLYQEIEVSRYFPEEKDKYFLKLNKHYMNNAFIKLEDVITFLVNAGITKIHKLENSKKYKDYRDMDLIVTMPQIPDNYPKSPINYINHLIEIDKKALSDYKKSKQLEKNQLLLQIGPDNVDEILFKRNQIKIYKESSLIAKSSNLVSAQTIGSDFNNLILMDDVDLTKSYSNNYYEILEFFGIEAVRTVIIKELLTLIKMSDAYIDPRHIVLIADWITMMGVITPVTSKGMTKHNLGALANANFKETNKAVKSHTMFNKRDNLKNISSAITAGKLIDVGTGMVESILDQEKVNRELITTITSDKKFVSMDNISALIELMEDGEYIDKKNDTYVDAPKIIPKMIPQAPDISFEFKETSLLEEIEPFDIRIPDIFDLSKILPIVSPKTILAAEFSNKCEPIRPEVISIENTIAIDDPVESYNFKPVDISLYQNVEFVETDKPPEISQLKKDESFFDELFQ